MRILVSITHQIYNYVQANPEFTVAEREEWGYISGEIMKRHEDEYKRDRIVNVMPSEFFLVKIYITSTQVYSQEKAAMRFAALLNVSEFR